jgi:hypothetical protein
MKILLVSLVLALGLTYPERAACDYCFNMECYSSWVCGSGCFCGKANGEQMGICMSGG